MSLYSRRPLDDRSNSRNDGPRLDIAFRREHTLGYRTLLRRAHLISAHTRGTYIHLFELKTTKNRTQEGTDMGAAGYTSVGPEKKADRLMI